MNDTAPLDRVTVTYACGHTAQLWRSAEQPTTESGLCWPCEMKAIGIDPDKVQWMPLASSPDRNERRRKSTRHSISWRAGGVS